MNKAKSTVTLAVLSFSSTLAIAAGHFKLTKRVGMSVGGGFQIATT
jgi:hypothetical protein